MVLWVSSLLALGLLIQGVKSSNIRIRRSSTGEESRKSNEAIAQLLSKYQHPALKGFHDRSVSEWYPPPYMSTKDISAYIEGISSPISSQEEQERKWPSKTLNHDFKNVDIGDRNYPLNFNPIKEVEDEDSRLGHPDDSSQNNPSSQMGFRDTTKKSPWPEPIQQTSEFRSSTNEKDKVKTNSEKGEPTAQLYKQEQDDNVLHKENAFSDVYFVAIVAGCSAAAAFGVIAAGYCFYKIQKNSKAAAEVDYPAYGVTGPNKEHNSSPNGDRKLAQSAQMYHYQQQKQQMIAVEKASTARQTSASDVDSEEENEEGDYTVYECPGLAPPGEMEVKNPLFNDESAPASPPIPPSRTLDK